MMVALKGALTKGYRGLRAFEEGGGLRRSKEDEICKWEVWMEEKEERGR